MDLQILSALQEDARLKNADLARRLGVAASTALERVRRLEDQGYIQGSKTIVNQQKLGFTVQAMVSVTLDRHNRQAIRPFEQGVRDLPFIRACYHLTGRFDYLLHVAARDLDHLGRLVKESIAGLSGVGRTETFIIFSEIKTDSGCPVELSPLAGDGSTVKDD